MIERERVAPCRRTPHGWLITLFTIGLLPLVGCGMDGGQAGAHRAVGTKLTTVKLTGLTGDSDDVALDDLKGKVAVINFWGTWCPPCVQEFPHIAALEKKYRDNDGFRLLAVSSAPDLPPNLSELKSDTIDFLEQAGSDIPTYADPDDSTRSHVEQVSGWLGYPTTIVIDGEGVIRGKWDGYAPGTENQIAAVVAELMSPKEPEPSSSGTGSAY